MCLLWKILGALGNQNLALIMSKLGCIYPLYYIYLCLLYTVWHAICLIYMYYRNGPKIGSKIGHITYKIYCDSPHITYIYMALYGYILCLYHQKWHK